jgi:AraC family transcriptional regulator
MKDALDLIEKKMEEPLDIEEIAKAAYSSPFHFQRMFHMLTGITLADYKRKRKLTLAAQELAMSSSKVVDVALKYGYDSPESFSKAFRKIHGIAPSEARNSGVSLKAFPRISFQLSLKGDIPVDYQILEKKAFTVVGKTFRTTMQNNEQTRQIPRFWGECYQDGTIAKLGSFSTDENMFGIMMDMQPGKDDFTYMIASKADVTSSPADGFVLSTIPASTWAIFTSIGPVTRAIPSVFGRIYQEWFPATGFEHSGAPEMEVYPPGDVTAEDYRCEIWVPIVKK